MLSVERVRESIRLSSTPSNDLLPSSRGGAQRNRALLLSRCSFPGNEPPAMSGSDPLWLPSAPANAGSEQVETSSGCASRNSDFLPGFAPPTSCPDQADDLSASISLGFEPLSSPAWNLGEADTWASLLGDPISADVLGDDDIMDLTLDPSQEAVGRSASMLPPPSMAPSARDYWPSSSLGAPVPVGLSDIPSLRFSGKASRMPSIGSRKHQLLKAPVAPARGMSPTLADHVRQVIRDHAAESAPLNSAPSQGHGFPSGSASYGVVSGPRGSGKLLADMSASAGVSASEPCAAAVAAVAAVSAPYSTSPDASAVLTSRSTDPSEPAAQLPVVSEVADVAGEWSIAELKGMLGLDEEDGLRLWQESEDLRKPGDSAMLEDMLREQQGDPEPLSSGSASTGNVCSGGEQRLRVGVKRGSSESDSGEDAAEPGLEHVTRVSPASGDASDSVSGEGGGCEGGAPGPAFCNSPPSVCRSVNCTEERLQVATASSAGRRALTHGSWHNKAAMILQRSVSDWTRDEAGETQDCHRIHVAGGREGCPCGRCHSSEELGAHARRFPASGSGTNNAGMVASAAAGQVVKEEDVLTEGRAGPPSVQAVDGKNRPGDLSNRLAAVIDRLGVTAGPTGVGLEVPASSADHQQQQLVLQQPQRQELPNQDLMALSRQQRQLLVLSTTATDASASRGKAAKAMRTAEGKAGGLKRDARRKKGRFGGDSGNNDSTLVLSSAVLPSLPSPQDVLGVASYYKTCDVDVSWRLTPSQLPSPSLPLLPSSSSTSVQDMGHFNPGDMPEFAPALSRQFGVGKGMDLGSFSSGSYSAGGSPPKSLPYAGAFFGPGLLPGMDDAQGSRAAGSGFQNKQQVREQLLALAEGYATDDVVRIRNLSRKLAKKADNMGTAEQRLVFYFLQALEARAEGTGAEKFMAPIAMAPADLNKAMQMLCMVVPFLQTCQLVNHEVILDATAGCESVHILALGIWHGDNWAQLFRRFADRSGGPPRKLRISGVDAPVTPGKLAIKLSSANVVLQIKAAAASVGLQAEVEFVPVPMEKLRSCNVRVLPGETLVVFSSMRFQFLPDASVVRSNPRDAILQTIFELKPKVFLLEDIDANFNSPFFLSRFKEALNYFGGVFECIDVAANKACPRRHTFEDSYFGRDIVNVVACEGLHRMCRAERMEQWADRCERMGFASRRMPPGVADKLRNLYACRAMEACKAGLNQFRVVETEGSLEVGWCEGRMMFASVWGTREKPN